MFAIELYLARAVENEIKLLRVLVIMPLCPGACGDARFRKALVLDGRIVRSRIERIVEPSFVIKGDWAERFWTVMVSQDAAMRCVTEARFLFNCRNLPQGAGREVYQKRRNPRTKEPGSGLGNERSEDTGPRSENSTQTGQVYRN